jgi:methylenetetrahydrofolate dehydrogenase (NADP+)/methenyltetrahydrofolate cyclohydrolase
MTAHIIDGKKVAGNIKEKVAQEVAQMRASGKHAPCVSFVLVGDDPASHYYINTKAKTCASVGIVSQDFKLPSSTSQADLLALIAELNARVDIHGILVQLPLPSHIHEQTIIAAIDPAKDVDGFHPMNAGQLANGERAMVACTPLGSLMLIKEVIADMSGLHAVVIGRSNIVGKPMAQLLLQENCTVTVCHSRTRNIADIVRQADIVVAAVGKPEMVKASWIKQGACVIDVGINRVERDGKTLLVGDVDFAEAQHVAGYISPVPGGVGPMTIACLMHNTLQAAQALQS